MKGSITQRSPGSYSIILDLGKDPATGKRRQKWHTFRGTKREAEIECARLITEMGAGEYVETSKLTVGQWIDQWVEAGAPGRRRKKVSQRTLERYGQLLRTHVKPGVGQSITPEIAGTTSRRALRQHGGSQNSYHLGRSIMSTLFSVPAWQPPTARV